MKATECGIGECEQCYSYGSIVSYNKQILCTDCLNELIKERRKLKWQKQ